MVFISSLLNIMKDKLLTPRNYTLGAILLLAAVSRVLPHPPNFAPITAMALLGGATLSNRKLAFIFPLVAMLISDTLLELTTGWGFHSGMFVVYGTFSLIVALGVWLKNRKSSINIALATFTGSLLFFVITNFFTWMSSGMYPQTFDGLLTCYTIALPFFGSSVLGDAVFSSLLFGGFALAERYLPNTITINS